MGHPEYQPGMMAGARPVPVHACRRLHLPAVRAEDQVQIVRLDAATGKYAPFADGKPAHTIAAIPADLGDWPGFKAGGRSE